MTIALFFPLSLHDALPICRHTTVRQMARLVGEALGKPIEPVARGEFRDRKSTRLNSSHPSTSYAVFCLQNQQADLQFHDSVFRLPLLRESVELSFLEVH